MTTESINGISLNQIETSVKKTNMINMLGQKIGKLLVVSEVANRKNGFVCWNCICECGNECVVKGIYLRKGKTISCGCYKKPRKLSGTDITGQTFGHLTAIAHLQNRDWLWKCDCGKTCRIRRTSVTSGKTTSCGHINSENKRKQITEKNPCGVFDGTVVTIFESKLRGNLNINNTSGYNGVRTRQTAKGTRYEARIQIRKKTISIGTFDTLEEAIAARRKKEEEIVVPVIEEYHRINS